MMRQDDNYNSRSNNNNSNQVYYAGNGQPASNMGFNVEASAYNYSAGGAGGDSGYYMPSTRNGCPPGMMMVPHDKAYIINTEPITISKDQHIVLVDPPTETYVKSYLTWSLFNVLFCCLLGGIVTTIMSFNVMQLNDSKKYKQAFRLSAKVLLANMIVSAIGAFTFLVVFPYVYVAIYPYLPKINW
jgi:hypothetical protein